MLPSSEDSWTSLSRSVLPCCSRKNSSSKLRSKWSSMARLPRPVMMRMSVRPAATASSTTYWIDGLSTTGNISLGWLFVAGRKRVPSPAAGMTAFFSPLRTARRYLSARGPLVAEIRWIVAFGGGIEAELLALHETADVRQMAHDDHARHHRDDDDVARFVACEGDRDRVRD